MTRWVVLALLPVATACGNSGSPVDAGCPTCADLCQGVVCDRPPAGTCSSLTEATTYASPGTCSAGNCSYKSATTTCSAPENGLSQCAAGTCVTSCNTGFELANGRCVKNVTALSVGAEHACAIVNGGAVCWGDNTPGELGDGTTMDSSVPVKVLGLSVGVTSIAAGAGYTCAVASGIVSCWGNNSSFTLGNENGQNPMPTAIPGLVKATVVVAGTDHACAVDDGAVKCWGLDAAGQLGNNNTADSPTPVASVGLGMGVTALAAGGEFTCALLASAPECWGSTGQVGDLGNGSMINGSGVPAALAAGSDAGPSMLMATAITAGNNHACMIVTGGGVDCWGDNDYGELGNGTEVPSDFPVPVMNLTSGATLLAQGSQADHSCALANGQVMCWGANADGQLGQAPSSSGMAHSEIPITVQGIQKVTALAVGSSGGGGGFSCAIADGDVMCWGDNTFGELGDGSMTSSPTPVKVQL